MENDVFINQQMMQLEDGKQVSLNYYVTSETSLENSMVYGIKVEKLGEMLEAEMTGPISGSEDWVLELCKKIADHQVTPMGLINIVDDMVTESLRM